MIESSDYRAERRRGFRTARSPVLATGLPTGAQRPMPSLPQLGYLVELAERLNFRAAAAAQLVTQSTLSAGIKELERVLGAQLVERDKRHVHLTAAGEEVVARARELLAGAADLAEVVRRSAGPLAGPL